MARAYFGIALLMAGLAGCSNTIRWQDMTSRQRGQDLVRIDLEGCKEKLHTNAVAAQTLVCMAEHGWKRMGT
jgi:hypothetical protein